MLIKLNLFLKKVITRVTKRFLLHNSRENEDIKESDFDELKMEFQAVKADMLNDIRGAKENLIRYSHMLYKGINLLSDLFFKQKVQMFVKLKQQPELEKSSVKYQTQEDMENRMNLFRSCANMFQNDIDELYNPMYNRFSSTASLVLSSPPVLNEK